MKKLIFMIILLYMFSSCKSMASYSLDKKQLCPVVPVIKRVLVLPFDIPSNGPYGLVKEGKIEEGSTEKLATFTEEKLRSFGCFDVVSWEQVVSRLQYEDAGKILADAKRGYKEEIVYLANLFKSDAVLVGYLTLYTERQGVDYGATKAASVAFSYYLYSGKDGSLLWNGSYRETQVSLSENLFNIVLYLKRGFRWLTADELAQWGVKEILKDFPGKK